MAQLRLENEELQRQLSKWNPFHLDTLMEGKVKKIAREHIFSNAKWISSHEQLQFSNQNSSISWFVTEHLDITGVINKKNIWNTIKSTVDTEITVHRNNVTQYIQEAWFGENHHHQNLTVFFCIAIA